MSCSCLYSSVLLCDILDFLLDHQQDLALRMHRIEDNKMNNKVFSSVAAQTDVAASSSELTSVY